MFHDNRRIGERGAGVTQHVGDERAARMFGQHEAAQERLADERGHEAGPKQNS